MMQPNLHPGLMVHIASEDSLVNNYLVCIDNGLGQGELQETAFLFGQIMIMIMIE